ncbi:hypothetical protein ACLKA7_013806 [Drosophila subpalustris]
MKRNATNHLNEKDALVIEEDPDDNAGQVAENNWSDLEEESINTDLDLDDDDDVAADEEDLIMTQESSDDEDDNEDEDAMDTDASAG